MRILKKLLKLSVFLCIMAAGVAGVIYMERETPWVEDFQYAIGIKQDAKPRGISFAGNKIGNQRRLRRSNDSFVGTLKMMFGMGAGEMVAARQEAVIANLEAIDLDYGAQAPEPDIDEVKKSNRSGSLGGSFGSN